MLSTSRFPYFNSASLFAGVAGQEWSVFFDSGLIQGQSPRVETERYDVLVTQPVTTLVTRDQVTYVESQSESFESQDDPLELVASALQNCLQTDGMDLAEHAYLPGAYGYFSYDLARRFEKIPSLAADSEKLPEMAIGIFDSVVVIDHKSKCTLLLSVDEYSSSAKFWRRVLEEAEQNTRSTKSGGMPLQAKELLSNQSRDEYQRKFDQVRRYTIDGDCYQVNLTKRFACEVHGSAWDTYQQLRSVSPAPYGCYMHLPFAEILSNSPESFIRCRNREVTTSPIKGTRPRDHDNAERDRNIASELRNSVKDRAENLMIVDLMRNDLSRCCELGSVKVPSLFRLHAFANVHHLISTVTGTLKTELHALDLLRSCFPGGSITGAPKIRSMEIIEELEPDRRGLYCGAIGYVGMDGSLETNIAIRTIVLKDGVARFSAGGGLVIDSVADEEYQELLDKASMMKMVLSSG